MNRPLIFLLFFLLSSISFGQKLRLKIVDSQTFKPLEAQLFLDDNQKSSIIVKGEISLSLEGVKTLKICKELYQCITVTYKHQPEIIIKLQKINNLDPVVISVNKKATKLLKVPAAIDLVSKTNIQSLAVTSLDESLKMTAGVDVQRPFGIFGKAVVSMRGIVSSEPGRQLTLIDGVPINKTDGGTVNWNRLLTADVDHIEVLKGAASSLYGSNAMGGVVNIITKKPDNSRLNGLLNLSYGAFNSLKTDFYAGKNFQYKMKGFYVMTAGEFFKGDGYISVPEKFRDTTDVPGFVNKKILHFKTGYNFNADQSIDLTYQYNDDHNGQGRKIYLPDGQTADFDTNFFQIDLNNTVKKLKIKTQFFYQLENYQKNIEKLKRNNYTLIEVNSDRKDYGALINMQYNSSKHLLNFGADMRFGSVDAADVYKTATDKVINKGQQNNYGIYIQDTYTSSNQKWHLIGALAYHFNEFKKGLFAVENPTRNTSFMLNDTGKLPQKKWQDFTYNFSIGYRTNFHSELYLSTGKAFRTPNLDDMTRTGFINIGYKLANPELQPETLYNFETGYKYFTSKFHLQTAVYFSKGFDFMNYVYTGNSLFHGRKLIYQKENISAVKIFGTEAAIQYKINSNINWRMTYTYNKSVIDKFENKPEYKGKNLAYVPNHVLNTGVRYKLKKWETSLNYTYKSKQFIDDLNEMYIPEQNLIDGQLAYQYSSKISLKLSVQNILNKQYLVTHDQMSIGRFWLLAVKYKF